MKPFKTIFFLLGITLLIVYGCKKNESAIIVDDKILKVESLTYTDCKQTTKSTSTGEYIEYQTVDNNYLSVKHVNASLNCCPDSIKVISSIKDGKILYNVCHKQPQCNCNCLYDITCKIGPLIYTRYDVSVNVCTGTTAGFSIDFNEDTKGKFEIGNK